MFTRKTSLKALLPRFEINTTKPTLINKPRFGRTKILDPEEGKAIVRAVKKESKLTAVDIYNDLELNQSYASIRIIQYLLKGLGLEATTTRPQQLSLEAVEQKLFLRTYK